MEEEKSKPEPQKEVEKEKSEEKMQEEKPEQEMQEEKPEQEMQEEKPEQEIQEEKPEQEMEVEEPKAQFEEEIPQEERQKEARAKLRQAYLEQVNALCATRCNILTHELSSVTSKFMYWTGDGEEVEVNNLETPAYINVPSAILRSHDILAMQFCVPAPGISPYETIHIRQRPTRRNYRWLME